MDWTQRRSTDIATMIECLVNEIFTEIYEYKLVHVQI